MIAIADEKVCYGQVMANIKPNPPLLGIFEPLFDGNQLPS